MRRLALGWLLLTLPCNAVAQPYDLRGIKLGIPLPEFRKLAFPDGGSAKVLCKGDPEEKLQFISDLWTHGEPRGALGCGFFNHRKFGGEKSPLPVRWEDANLKVATIAVWATYVFLPDAANTLRLYKIKIRSNVSYWNSFWEGYLGRYGKPAKLSNDPVQNKLGARFDNVVALWENQESTILLEKRAEELERTRITYVHKGLLATANASELKAKGHPKDNL